MKQIISRMPELMTTVSDGTELRRIAVKADLPCGWCGRGSSLLWLDGNVIPVGGGSGVFCTIRCAERRRARPNSDR